jgi:hypothetical protein
MENRMRTIIATLTFALLPGAALAATLPLDDGDYTKGQCKAGSSDYLESFDIQTNNSGPQKGKRILYPQAEGQEGGCFVSQISASGMRMTGSAKCEGGGSRIQYSTGTYKFSIEVLDRKTFISKGKKYSWCSAHR